MHYVTVFDAAEEPARNLWFLFPGVVLAMAGALMVFRPAYLRGLGGGFTKAGARPVFAWLFFLFSLVWLVLSGTSLITEQDRAGELAKTNGCRWVEGTVEDFSPAPIEGHKDESFTVGGKRFSYSDYVITPGFHQSASHGGPIKAGLPVRICYDRSLILKLEVSRG